MLGPSEFYTLFSGWCGLKVEGYGLPEEVRA